jgi:carbonic anhydrase/acetyltransferase-like protein (isoleucine patch superfamily)
MLKNMEPLILPYNKILPKISPAAFIAPGAAIIGDVEIGAGSGVWFNVTIRADVAEIRIGERSNIQDGTSVHVTRNGHPTIIGNGVTVGHAALLHACRLEDNSFVGMGAIVMDDTVVESNAMLAAGAMLTPGKRVPGGQLWAGRPAKYFRDLSAEEIAFIPISSANYARHVEEYLLELNAKS